MNARKMILIAAAGLIAAYLLYSVSTRDRSESGYIMEQGSLSLKEVRDSMRKIDFNSDAVREHFGSGHINRHTIDFFNSLQRRFGEFRNLEDHFSQVEEYLLTLMSPEEAGRLMTLYRSYIRFQKNLFAEMSTWGMPSDTEGAVQYLRKIQEYRRNFFGRETADVLFGASVMAKEYSLRRGAILNDTGLHGSKKEEMLKKLNREMWGESASDLERSMSTFDRYQEKLQLYSKDLGELTSSERKEMIEGFRKDIFPPEAVERFEKLDEKLADEERKEKTYRGEEEKILRDPDLSQAEKEKRIEELQNSVFGDEAEDFRNRDLFQKNVIGQ